jgi:catechol 2,3-dioxygenase-like lactoylglutathione lyase family enzyme
VQAKIFFITLAVDDLERSVAFYRDGLGWPTEGIVGREFHDEITGADGTIAFFKLDGACCSACTNGTTSPRTPACRQVRPAPPSSAWASPLNHRQRSTACSGKSRPLGAR